MSISEDISGIISMLLDGLKTISELHPNECGPFEELLTAINNEFKSFDKFNFKSNKNHPLFRKELTTMTDFLEKRLTRIKKKEKGYRIKRRAILFESMEEKWEGKLLHLSLAGATPTIGLTEDDSLIKKFLENGLTVLGSLKSWLGSKFQMFLEVLEEITKVFLTELF